MTPPRLLLVAALFAAISTVRAADPAPTTEPAAEPSDSEIGAALKAINAQHSEAPTSELAHASAASSTSSIPSVTIPESETAHATPATSATTTALASPATPAATPALAFLAEPPASPVKPATPQPHAEPTTPALPAISVDHASTPTPPLAPAHAETRAVEYTPAKVEFPPAAAVSKIQPHATEPAHVTETAAPVAHTSTAAPHPSIAHTSPAANNAHAVPAVVAIPSPAPAAPAVHVDHSTASPAEHAAAPADNSLKLTVSVPTESESDSAIPPLTPDSDLASLLRIGDAKRDQRDWPSATLAYRQVLNATNRATVDQTQAALLGLARSHRGAGNLTKACAVYEMFAKDYPGDAQLPTVYLELGRCLRVLGAHRLAISRFYSVINSTLKVSTEGTDRYRQLTRTAQFEIAETYFQAGDYEQAHRFYSRLALLDLAPTDRARAAFKSAYALNLQGNYEKAVTDLRSCIALYPEGENAPEARYLLSLALRRLGRNQESLAAALELLKIEQSRTKADPKNWAHWQRKTGNQLANEFYEQGDASTALVIYQCLYDLGGPAEWRIPALYQIGLCQERLRQTGLARKTYQSILDTLRAPSGDGGKTAGLADVASMAEWRLRHLDWLETTDKRLLVFVPPPHVEAPKSPATPVPAATP